MSDTPALPPRYSTYMLGNLNKSDDGPLMLVEDILALNVAWSKVLDERDAKFQRDLAAAQSYATTLAVSMHKQHYAEDAPNWRPLPDLVGLLTQIDNMYAGLRNDFEAALVENKRLVGLPLAALLEERYALQIAWETAKKQNSHDMLLSGDEIHQHDEAIWIAGGRK